MSELDIRAGVENLLLNCGALSAGDHLLILRECPSQDYYCAEIAEAVYQCAWDMGIQAQVQIAPFEPTEAHLPDDLVTAMNTADKTLFLSRHGDQIRFSRNMNGARPIMSYALDAKSLSSGFGRANYHGFVDLKNAVNDLLSQARHIRITCPLGTDFSGPGASFPPTGPQDVTVDRFPMLVFAPIPTAGFSGVILQEGFLVGTGSKFYQPYAAPLNDPIAVHFEGAVLQDITGHPEDVAVARAHYQNVGDMFGLDPFSMHSWHAGIHPGCTYPTPAAENFERWSGSAFGNPRLLHYHTCGDYAPGEISLNVLDPTITVDGVEVWSAGQFDPTRVPGGAEILDRYACIRSVFETPSQQVGQGANGRLCGT